LARILAQARIVTIAKSAATVCYPARYLKPNPYHYSIRVPLSQKRPWAKKSSDTPAQHAWAVPHAFSANATAVPSASKSYSSPDYNCLECDRLPAKAEELGPSAQGIRPQANGCCQKETAAVGFSDELHRNTSSEKGGYSNMAFTRNQLPYQPV
jgi:hypothetical protein